MRGAFFVSVASLALALIGYFARDRMPAVAGLTYLPLLPIALAAIAVAVFPGVSRHARVGLASAGVLASLWALPSMVGFRHSDRLESTGPGLVRLLQWNVLGGGRVRSSNWSATLAAIVRESPDIAVLSEAPRDRALSELTARLGAGWSSVEVEGRRPSGYWYKLVLASRWPVHLLREQSVDRGQTMLVQVDSPERPLRILVVDGESDPMRDRGSMLDDIAQIVRAEGRAGMPIDVLAGDFNAPARSQGFDQLWQQGYRLAANASSGWRATFPMILPLLDIDHVLIRTPLPFDCAFFSSPSSDHRGQLVRFRVDSAVAKR